MMKVFALSCLVALAGAAPAAEAEADAQYLLGHGAPYAAAPLAVAAPAPHCVTEQVTLVTQVCTPAAQEVCSTQTIPTQEIEYEKICTEIVNTLCDTPAVAAPVAVAAGYHAYGKREAEAEADAEAQYYAYPQHAAYAAAPLAAAPLAHAVAPLPVAHAVAHSVTETVKHACREVTTEHCVDNPKIIEVPVEVENCHTVTKVACVNEPKLLPKTTCEAVVTQQTQHAALPVATAAYTHAGYGYGK